MRTGLIPSVVTLFFALCAIGLANADDDAPAVVLIAEQQEEEATRDLAWAIRTQLADLDVRFDLYWVDRLDPDLPSQSGVAAGVAHVEGALLVLWCDLSSVEQVFRYLADPGGGRVLARKVTTAGAGAEGRFEAIAVIVRSSVEAMSLGGRIGIGVDVAEAPGEPESRGVQLSLAVGYELRGLSREEPATHAAFLSAELGLVGNLSLVAGYGLRPGIRVEDPDATLSLLAHDIQLGAALDWSYRRISVGGKAAADLGLLRRHVEVHSDRWSALPAGVDVTFGVLVEARFTVRILSRLRLTTGPGAVLVLRNHDYDLEDGGRSRSILTPWTVQPYWALALSARLD